ncbi:uncharacterized protein LOC129602679 [Paramacrobiotus metropolitanus]|uniref:uncharacterized protein LOC129602679 n=1 Tax=Paramacrobiotus metropolitanus TaxID=2943436 RepID=UPI00244643C9|nr:uncharacterized protein LOC129602679 [Paramacrobiotus metropolitanus]
MASDLPTALHRPKQVMCFGVLQLLLACVLIAMDVTTMIVTGIVMGLVHTAFCAGIWLGVFYLITSCFGICGGRPLPVGQSAHGRRCCLCTSAVMSLLCIISSGGLVIYHSTFINYYDEWRAYYVNYVHQYWAYLNLADVDILTPTGYSIMAGYLSVYLIFTLCCLAQTVLAFVEFCTIRKTPMTTITRLAMKEVPAEPKV